MAFIDNGASKGLGLQSMMRDFGVDMAIMINIVASAARGIACRRGFGKVKINGKEHVAYLFTKHVDAEDVRVHLHRSNQTVVEGRHDVALADDS